MYLLFYILEIRGEKSAYNLTEVSNPCSFLPKYPTAFTVISFPSYKVISDEKALKVVIGYDIMVI